MNIYAILKHLYDSIEEFLGLHTSEEDSDSSSSETDDSLPSLSEGS